MKTLTIIQSNYIPWKGYFDLIGMSDEFIILDTVQFTKNDWRNRNKIKTPAGLHWLTIPVKTGGKFGQSILEAEIADPSWAEKHWSKIDAVYAGSDGFAVHGGAIKALYEAAERETRLSSVNRMFIEGICSGVGIATKITSSEQFPLFPGKSERLVSFCKAVGADRYLSGPAAQAYLDEAPFREAGIEVAYIDYSGYVSYPQPYPPFEHGVSILDLMFGAGVRAADFMKFSGSPRG